MIRVLSFQESVDVLSHYLLIVFVSAININLSVKIKDLGIINIVGFIVCFCPLKNISGCNVQVAEKKDFNPTK